MNEVKIDSQTAFFTNGDINIYPCSYEHPEPLTDNFRGVTYQGSITVMDDGRARVKAYNIGAHGPQYIELFRTEHCSVLKTQRGTIIERWKFDPRLSVQEVCRIRKWETPIINSFFKNLK